MPQAEIIFLLAQKSRVLELKVYVTLMGILLIIFLCYLAFCHKKPEEIHLIKELFYFILQIEKFNPCLLGLCALGLW